MDLNQLMSNMGMNLVDIQNPPKKLLDVISSKSPKDAYITLSTTFGFEYGGKVAGRILSAHYLQQLDIEERIKEMVTIPRGFALTPENMVFGLEEVSQWFVNKHIPEVLVRSSATVEDTFENNWAGLGRTERLQVKSSDQLYIDILTAFRQGKDYIHNFLHTKYNVVVDEFIPVSAIAVAYSRSPVSIGKIDVTCYLDNHGKIDLYAKGDELGDSINLVDRRSFSMLSVPRVLNNKLFVDRLHLQERNPLSEWFALQSSFQSVNGCPVVSEEVLERLFKIRPGLSSHSTDYQEDITNYHKNHPTSLQIKDIAKIARAYEKKLGFEVDIEVGIDNKSGRYHLFQIRPIVPKILRARKGLPSSVNNIIFSTQVVNNEFEYYGPLYVNPNNQQGIESLVKVFNPQEERIQRRGKEELLFSELGDKCNKCRYSTIQIGLLRKNIVSGVTGHGGEWVVEAPVNDKIFVHPHVYSFVMAIGEKVEENTFRTPFDVQIVSDGRVGFISIPNKRDFDSYLNLAQQKIKDYEQKLFPKA